MARALVSLMSAIFGGGENESTPVEKPFETPSDIKFEGGYGATEADLKCGYIEPVLRESPEYDKENYEDRFSQPKRPLLNDGDFPDEKDWEFRRKDRESRGFLARPRIPTER